MVAEPQELRWPWGTGVTPEQPALSEYEADHLAAAALRPRGGGSPRPALPPPHGADRNHDGRQHRLDHAGSDQVAGIGEVEPVVGVDLDHARRSSFLVVRITSPSAA
jgi:hypothetical protein